MQHNDTRYGKNSTANLDQIPEALRERRCWMGTRLEPRRGSGATGKLDKPPYSVVSGQPVRKADKTEPENWSTFDEAVAALERGAVDAIGYVFTEDRPEWVADLDDCIDPDTGEIAEAASAIMRKLDTYSEISCSGRGVHIIAQGKKPPFAKCRSRALGIGVEVYDKGRFVVLTGRRISSTRAAEDRQGQLDELCRKLW